MQTAILLLSEIKFERYNIGACDNRPVKCHASKKAIGNGFAENDMKRCKSFVLKRTPEKPRKFNKKGLPVLAQTGFILPRKRIKSVVI